jgi:hypothetical protein
MTTRNEKAQARNEKFLARLEKAGGKTITLSALPFDRADGKTRKQVQGRQSALAQQFREWAQTRGVQVEVRSRSTETSARLDGKLVVDSTFANDQRVKATSFIARRTVSAAVPESPKLSAFYVDKLNKALRSDKFVNLQATSGPSEKDRARLTAYYEDLSSLAMANTLPVVFKLYDSARSITLVGKRV